MVKLLGESVVAISDGNQKGLVDCAYHFESLIADMRKCGGLNHERAKRKAVPTP